MGAVAVLVGMLFLRAGDDRADAVVADARSLLLVVLGVCGSAPLWITAQAGGT